MLSFCAIAAVFIEPYAHIKTNTSEYFIYEYQYEMAFNVPLVLR